MGEVVERTRSKFREIVSGKDDEIDLGEAALLIAAEEYPRLTSVTEGCYWRRYTAQQLRLNS